MPENCAAIIVAAKHHELTKVKDIRGTTHTIGALRCKFQFRTDDWLHSAKTAMFCNGNAILHPEVIENSISVPLDADDECPVPYEVLIDTQPYSIGVWGITDTGLRIVSNWLVFGAQTGCYAKGSVPDEPELTVYEQILQISKHASTQAEEVVARADRGEFNGKDGYTPVKGIDYFDGQPGRDGKDGVDGKDGYTPVKGVDYFDGKDGVDGKDGYTPVKGVDYFDGLNGKDGVDAISPTVSIEDIDGGHRIIITDKDGDKIFDVMDGLGSGASINQHKAARIGEVTLLADAWVGEDNLYSQVVNIEGVTENSQVDLTPDVQQLAVFYNKDISFVTENEGGVVTVYVIGQKPENDYTIQATITEVDV